MSRIYWFIIPAAAFFIKDVVATMVLLATEPGISERAISYYALALFPGSLVAPGFPMLFNVCFGATIGGVVYLLAILRKRHSA